MKFITTVQKNWTNVALCAISLTTASAYSTHNHKADTEAAIAFTKIVGAMIIGQDQLMTQFFSLDNPTPYKDFIPAFTKKDTEYINKSEGITIVGKLSKLAQDIFEEARKYFSAAIGVIKQYNGKPADQALKFVADMDKVFSAERAFTSITTKLQILLKEAEATEETELIQVVQQLLAILQKKKTEWSKKTNLSLLTGLTKRMSK